jgi:hypothetical protein
MIVKEFYTNTTLAHDIDELRNPQTAITPVRVANIVTKFFVSYVLGQNGKWVINFVDAKAVFEVVCWARSKQKSWEYSHTTPSEDIDIGDAHYQITMLGDVASTTEIGIEILTGGLLKTRTQSRTAHILDLGTGSGILLLFGHIRASRLRQRIEYSTGVEYSGSVAHRSHSLAESLSFGRIIQGDTTLASTYTILPATPTIILNENLPFGHIPFMFKKTDGAIVMEPFIHNSFCLDKQFWGALKDSYMFPRRTTLLSGSERVQGTFGLRAETPDHALWRAIDTKIASWENTCLSICREEAYHKKALTELAGKIAPESILIGWQLYPLGQVGAMYRSYPWDSLAEHPIVDQLLTTKRW